MGPPHVCNLPPESQLFPQRPLAQGDSPVVWIHDGNEEDVDAVSLVENDLVLCRASQDLIRDFGPSQGCVVVRIVAAHIILGRRTETCLLAPGAGEDHASPQVPPPTSTHGCESGTKCPLGRPADL